MLGSRHLTIENHISKPMKKQKLKLLAATALAGAFLNGSFAGTFKHITIDGSFGDWTGVPLAYTQAQDVFNVVAFKDLYIANDENYLYVRFSIYNEGSSSNNTVFTSLQNYFFNTDNLPTGYTSHGVGSEMLIQSGAGYQQKNGGFNEGAINGLDWAGLPAGPGTNFEFRVSRNATYASDSMPVFTAATAMSATTASICARTILADAVSTAMTPRVFWAVRAVRALVPYTPSAANVFRSAWMPAPPPESLPAMVRAMGSMVASLYRLRALGCRLQAQSPSIRDPRSAIPDPRPPPSPLHHIVRTNADPSG